MTQGDLAAYWGAIAQVIPVVALAFVIEARMIVRRLSKKTAFSNRGARIRWSVVFFILATLLTVSEYVALRSLALNPDMEFPPFHAVYFWLSLIGVIASLLVVVSLPLAAMVSASTRDVARWVQVHLPWGEAQQLRRLILGQLADLEGAIRETKSQRLDALFLAAAVLLEQEVKLDVMRKALVEALSDKKHVEIIDPSGELRELANADPNQDMWGYRVSRLMYEGLVSRHRDMRKLRRQIRGQLSRIEKVTNVNSPEFVKIQRANMAAAARMP